MHTTMARTKRPSPEAVKAAERLKLAQACTAKETPQPTRSPVESVEVDVPDSRVKKLFSIDVSDVSSEVLQARLDELVKAEKERLQAEEQRLLNSPTGADKKADIHKARKALMGEEPTSYKPLVDPTEAKINVHDILADQLYNASKEDNAAPPPTSAYKPFDKSMPSKIETPLQLEFTLRLATVLYKTRAYVESKLIDADKLFASGLIKLDALLVALNDYINYELLPAASTEAKLMHGIRRYVARMKDSLAIEESRERPEDFIKRTLEELQFKTPLKAAAN